MTAGGAGAFGAEALGATLGAGPVGAGVRASGLPEATAGAAESEATGAVSAAPVVNVG